MSNADTEPAASRGLPDNWDQMSDEERQAWADEREAELHQAAEDAIKLTPTEQEALDVLSEPVEGETATVEINGQPLEVRTYLDAEHEDLLNDIATKTDDLGEVRQDMTEVMSWIIVDDRYGGETGKKVWRAFAEKYGVSSLAEAFFKAVEPVIDRMLDSEAARRFREDGPGPGALPDRR